MKKALIVILIASMFLSVIFSLNVYAEGETVIFDGIEYTSHDTYCTVTRCDQSVSGDIVIPSSVDFDGKSISVTSIGHYAFFDCNNLTSVTIPDGVTSIESYAFLACDNLISVNIPDSVTIIDEGAFYDCTALSGIEVDENNENYISYDGVLFSKDMKTLVECPYAKAPEYTIPDGVTSIESYAFIGCAELKSVTIPESVTSIGGGAFADCRSLTSVTIGEGITSIGIGMFDGCTDLIRVIIPNSVEEIEEYAFRGCESIEKIYYLGTEEQWYSTVIVYRENENIHSKLIFHPEHEYDDDGIICKVCGYERRLQKSGDVNGDNEVNNKDVVILFRAVSSGAEYNKTYDYNGDGEINNKDVVALFRYVSTAK